jgi:hypothetical protein
MKIKLIIFIVLIPLIILAKKTYDPWYTGSLIAESANNVDKGQINIQPYLYYTDNYGEYRRRHHIPNTFIFQSETSFQIGITKWLDFTVDATAYYSEKEKKDSFKFGDITGSFGIQVMKEKDLTYQPSIRIKIEQSFPTGKYNNLNPNKKGIDSSGSGSYETEFQFLMSKVIYWFTNHPIAWRLNLMYTLPTNVKVKNFNTYGGGYNTKGTVKPDKIFTGIVAFEFSFTQRWVYAMDIVYIYTTKATFKGIPGTLEDGTTASNTLPSSYQLSLAPAIEYNFNENLGALGGMQFTVKGRNSMEFYSGIISVTYTF